MVPGYGLVGRNQPCRTVGGDYYDFSHRERPAAAGPRRRLGQGHRRRAAHDRAARRRARPLDGGLARGRGGPHQPHRLPERARRTSTSPSSWRPSTPPRAARLRERRPQPARCWCAPTGSVEKLSEGGMVLGMFEAVPLRRGHGRDAPGRHPAHLLGRRHRDLGPRAATSSARTRASPRGPAREGRWKPPACRTRSCASSSASRGGQGHRRPHADRARSATSTARQATGRGGLP